MPRLVEYFVVLGFDFEGPSGAKNGLVLQRFPSQSWPDYPFESRIEQFCQPSGWSLERSCNPPSFFMVRLTDAQANAYYVACLTFYEPVTSTQLEKLALPRNGSQIRYTNTNPNTGINHNSSLPRRILHSNHNDSYSESDTTRSTLDPHIVTSSDWYAPKCLVLIARHQHFDVLKNCLGLIYTAFADGSQIYSLERIVATLLVGVDIPTQCGSRLTFSLGVGDRQMIQPPRCNTVPVTQTSVSNLFDHLGIYNVLLLIRALLSEQSVLLRSRSYNRLTESCEALIALLYPLNDSLSLVPIVPLQLIDCLELPTPFLYGVNTSYCPSQSELPDTIIVADLDLGSVLCPDQCDPPDFPKIYYDEVIESLFQLLKPQLLSSDALYCLKEDVPRVHQTDRALQDKQIRAIFIRLFACLLTGYRSCLTVTRIHTCPVIRFNKSLFLLLRGIPSTDQFFQSFLSSMRFETFIKERSSPFRACDLFDKEYDTVSQFHTDDRDRPICSLTSDDLSRKLLSNERGDGPIEHVLPDQATEAHKRIHHSHFPLLDQDLIDEVIKQQLEQRTFSTTQHQTEPLFIPHGKHLDRDIFKPKMYPDKYRVIREFVADIFNHHITEALKRRNTIYQDLRLTPFRRMFVDELNRSTDSPGPISHEQFELLVDLLDEALCQETKSTDNSGIVPMVLDLCNKFVTQLDTTRFYAYMTPQIQRHPFWMTVPFWEQFFNQYIDNQLRMLYVDLANQRRRSVRSPVAPLRAIDSRSDDSRREARKSVVRPSICERSVSPYTCTTSTLDITAEELRLARQKSSESLEPCVKHELSTIRAALIHLVSQIINFSVPVNLLNELTKFIPTTDTVSPYSPNNTSNTAAGSLHHPSLAAQLNDHRSGRPRSNKKSRLNSAQAGTTSSSSCIRLTSDSSGSFFSRELKMSDPISFQKELCKWLSIFVEKLVLDNNLPREMCQEAQSMIEEIFESHLSNINLVYDELKVIPKSKKPEIASPTLIPGEVMRSIGSASRLHCQLLPDARVDHMDDGHSILDPSNNPDTHCALEALIRPLLPAQGALFVSNYRVIFIGVPKDPYQSNRIITRSFPLASLSVIRRMGVQKVATLHSIIPGAVSNANFDSPLPSSSLEESLDVWCLSSFTFQLLRLGFDSSDGSHDLVKKELQELLCKTPRFMLPLNFGLFAPKSSSPDSAIKSDDQSDLNKSNLITSGGNVNESLSPDGSCKRLHSIQMAPSDSYLPLSDEWVKMPLAMTSLINNHLGTVNRLLARLLRESLGYADLSRFQQQQQSTLSPDPTSPVIRSAKIADVPTLSIVNSKHQLVKSYPCLLLMPPNPPHVRLDQVCRTHRDNKLPVIVWRHPKTGAYLLRGAGFEKSSAFSFQKISNEADGTKVKRRRGQPQKEQIQYFEAIQRITFRRNTSEGSVSASLSIPSQTDDGLRSSIGSIDDSDQSLTGEPTLKGNGDSPLTSPSVKSRTGAFRVGLNKSKYNSMYNLPTTTTTTTGSSERQDASLTYLVDDDSFSFFNADDKWFQFEHYSRQALSRVGLSRIRKSIASSVSNHRHRQPSENGRSSGSSSPVGSDGSQTNLSLASSSSYYSSVVSTSSSLLVVTDKRAPKYLQHLLPPTFLIRQHLVKAPQLFATSFLTFDRGSSTSSLLHDTFVNLIGDILPFNVVATSKRQSDDDEMASSLTSSPPTSQAVSDWLLQLKSLLDQACVIGQLLNHGSADFDPNGGTSVVVCMEHGNSLVAQLVSLAQLMLDPVYRTIPGFCALIEKEWLMFGYPFDSNAGQTSFSPYFLQFLDAVHQLVHQFPLSFEFNDFFLQFLANHHLSSRFHNFKHDTELERLSLWLSAGLNKPKETLDRYSDASIWTYIRLHHKEWPVFFNFHYTPDQKEHLFLAESTFLQVIYPSTNMPSLKLWKFYLQDDLASGSVFDLDHFCPSYRKLIERPYEHVLRQGFNNSHVDQVYAVLGLRENEEAINWLESWNRAQKSTTDDVKTLNNCLARLIRLSQIDPLLSIGADKRLHWSFDRVVEPTARSNPDMLIKTSMLDLIKSDDRIKGNKMEIFPHERSTSSVNDIAAASLHVDHRDVLNGSSSGEDYRHLVWMANQYDEFYGGEVAKSSVYHDHQINICKLQSRKSSRATLNLPDDNDSDQWSPKRNASFARPSVLDSTRDDSSVVFKRPHKFELISSISKPTSRCPICRQLFLLRGRSVACVVCNRFVCHEHCAPGAPLNCCTTDASSSSLKPPPVPGKFVARKVSSRLSSSTGSSSSLKPEVPLEHSSESLIPLNLPAASANFSGCLFKKSHHKLSGQWNERFFVLDTIRNQLYYYHSSEDLVKRGCIDLQEVVHITLSKQDCPQRPGLLSTFELDTSMRNYLFAAPSESDARAWVDHILDAIQ